MSMNYGMPPSAFNGPYMMGGSPGSAAANAYPGSFYAQQQPMMLGANGPYGVPQPGAAAFFPSITPYNMALPAAPPMTAMPGSPQNPYLGGPVMFAGTGNTDSTHFSGTCKTPNCC
jgi:hypothetical protein